MDAAELIRFALYGILPSGAAALLLVGLFGPRWLGVAAGLGLLVTHGLLRQGFPAWPHELWHSGNNANLWYCWASLGCGLVVAAHPRRQLPVAVVVPPGLLLLAAQYWLVLTNLRRRWDLTETVLRHGSFAAVAAVTWLGVRRLLVARPGPLSIWALAGCLGADAGLLHLGRSTFQGQIAGAAAVAFAASAGTALWRHGLAFEPAVAFVFAWLHCGLMALGCQLGEVPVGAALVAALAPAVLAIGERSGARFALALAATATLFAVAFVWVLSG